MLLQTCMNFFLLLNAKEDILNISVTKQFLVAVDIHSMKENTLKVNGYKMMT